MLNVKPNVYTDFNSLAQLKNEAKEQTPEVIREVANQFESIFVGMMLKSMRQAKLADGIFDNSQSEAYRDMYDQQLSVHLAGERGIGLADLIVKQLSPDQSVGVVREQKIGEYQRQGLIRHPLNETGKNSSADQIDKSVIKQDKTQDSRLYDFVQQLRPYAEKAAKELGVEADVLLAQAALETGWGKSVIKLSDGTSSHNLFNIKADKSWYGDKAKATTLEFRDGVANKQVAGFRSYASYQQSFDDYVNFIKTNPRYKVAIKMAKQPERYMHELQKAGYATDPQYAEKVMKIYKSSAISNQPADFVVMK